MNSLYTLKAVFLVIISMLATFPAAGQEKFNIAAGLGYPELLNLGIRYQMGQSQLGVSAGFFPDRYEDIFSMGADYFYHFEGSSTLSTRRIWYGRLGLNYYSLKNEYENYKYLILSPRIGKDFNLSPKVGIAADGGLSFILSRNGEKLIGEMRNDMGLSLGFSLFYRL